MHSQHCNSLLLDADMLRSSLEDNRRQPLTTNSVRLTSHHLSSYPSCTSDLITTFSERKNAQSQRQPHTLSCISGLPAIISKRSIGDHFRKRNPLGSPMQEAGDICSCTKAEQSHDPRSVPAGKRPRKSFLLERTQREKFSQNLF